MPVVETVVAIVPVGPFVRDYLKCLLNNPTAET